MQLALTFKNLSRMLLPVLDGPRKVCVQNFVGSNTAHRLFHKVFRADNLFDGAN